MKTAQLLGLFLTGLSTTAFLSACAIALPFMRWGALLLLCGVGVLLVSGLMGVGLFAALRAGALRRDTVALAQVPAAIVLLVFFVGCAVGIYVGS